MSERFTRTEKEYNDLLLRYCKLKASEINNSPLRGYDGMADELTKSDGQLKEIREYCLNHKEQMWAAKIGGIIDECDFRDFGSKI